MAFQSILCPVDFSDASADAVRYACALAVLHRAKLTLLHAAQPIGLDFSLVEPAQRRLEELGDQRARAIRKALKDFPGSPEIVCDVQREFAEGDPAEEIVKASSGHDLIVMSTHGAGAVKRWLLMGSVTSKVLQRCGCSVMAATDFAGRAPDFNRIVCAIDMGESSRHVLCGAARLARESGASLTIVHALPDYGEAAQDFVDEEWRSTLTVRVRSAITELQKETSAAGDIVVEAGAPYNVVPRTAQRSDAGLIVIGRSTSKGLLGRLRADAYEIIRNSPCPVLVI